MDQVYENIWIGDISDAREISMKDKGISTVITVCQDSVADNIGCQYYFFEMSDGPDNRYGGDHSYSMYSEAADTLYESVNNNDKTLIHCHKGQSRSVSVVVGVMGRIEGLTAETALSRIKQKRTQADPDELLLDHAEKYINSHIK